jgi:hypothetical protein
MTASSCKVVKAVVFIRQQLCCSSVAVLFGQLLPQQGGAIQFWMLFSVPEISSGIHLQPCFGRLVYWSTPSFSLYPSADLCWVPADLLGNWFVGPPLLWAFASLWSVTESSVLRAWFLAPSLTVEQWEIISLPHLHSLGQVQHSTPMSNVGVRLQFTLYSFQLWWGVQSALGLCWTIFLGWSGFGMWVEELHVVHDVHFFLLYFHADSFVVCWKLFSVWHRTVKLSTG